MDVGERWELEQDDGTFTLESPTLRQTQEVIKTNEETITPNSLVIAAIQGEANQENITAAPSSNLSTIAQRSHELFYY